MNTESVQKAQSVIKLIDYLKNIQYVQNSKALQVTLKERCFNIEFLILLKDIIMSPHMDELNQQTMINIRSSAAILLNRCFALHEESKKFVLTLEESVQFYYQVLFNMNISVNIKRSFEPSFIALLKREEIQLADFFEEGFQKLVRIVQSYHSRIGQLQNQNIVISEEIIFRKGIKPFQIIFELPKRLKETYNLIIVFANIFFDLLGQRTPVYQQKILETWKIFQSLIFTDYVLQNHLDIILRTLIVWDNFIFNGIELNRKLNPSYLFIYNCPQFSQKLFFILNYKALKVDQSSNTYNYFFINEDADNTQLMQLKQKVIEIICTFTQLLQVYQIAQALTYKSSFFQSMRSIENSLLTSINYSIKHKNAVVEETIYINMLQLFSVWLQLKYAQLSQEMRVHYLLEVVIPLVENQLKQYQSIFGPQDRAEELISELNDCCQNQQQSSKLSNACKILQQLVDGSTQLYPFIKQYALQSIISSKIAHFQLESSFNFESLQRLSNPAACFLLSITNYRDEADQKGLKLSIFAEIINQTYFPMFTNYQKQYIFFFCAFGFLQIFKYNNNAIQYLIKVSLSNQYSHNVKCFALDFLSNICEDYYSQSFSSQLMQTFFSINIETKWSIICKLLRKFIKHIDEQRLCKFVSAFFERVRKEARSTAKLRSKGKPVKANDATLCLSICRQISHSYDGICQKPHLQKLLLNSIQYIGEISILSLDDVLVGICNDIIDNFSQLPNNLLNVLEDVATIYRNGEFKGREYQVFYAICLEKLNQQNKQQESMNQIQAIYDMIIEGAGYFAYYPDDLTNDHFDDLSTHLFLLQKIYILYGDKLITRYLLQTSKICEDLITKISPTRQPLILSRLMNMMLLCKITDQTQGKIYPINEIYNIARNKYYLFSYDSSFLIFLLTQVTPELREDQIALSVSIAIAVCDSWKSYSRNRNLREKSRLFRQNNILSHVTTPVTLEENPVEQIKVYIKSLNQFNPDWFEIMKHHFTDNEIQSLKTLYQQKTNNFAFLGSQSLDDDYYEDSNSYQSNEATINDDKPNDSYRRIIKVSRGLQSSNGVMVDIPAPVKRDYHKDESCIDQEQSIKKHGGKKQKLQSLIVHEISKKEINNEKIAKRSQRT